MSTFGDEWYHKVGFACFIEWGIVHIFSMFIVIPTAWNGKISSMYIGGEGNPVGMWAYPGRPEKEFKADYENMRGKWPAFSGKVLSHHGLNLGWIGGWSIWVAFLLQDNNEMAWACALAPFFFDIGYWIHYDWFELAGKTGEAQTYIISMGLYCCGLALRDASATPYISENVMLGVPIAFVSTAALVKVL